MFALLTSLAINIQGDPEIFDCHSAYGTQDKCLVYSAGFPDFLVTYKCDGNYPIWKDEVMKFFPSKGVVQQAGRNYLCEVVAVKQLAITDPSLAQL